MPLAPGVPVPSVVDAIREGHRAGRACRAPGALAVTVAVNVTDWPNTDGLAEAFTWWWSTPGCYHP